MKQCCLIFGVAGWLRIEAAICALIALGTFVVPDILIRFLAQAPLGSLAGWMDVVVLVRTVGVLHLAMAAIHLMAGSAPASPSLRWLAGTLRVLTGVARWHILVALPSVLAWGAWIELGMMGLTLAALLRTPAAATPVGPAVALLAKFPRLRLGLWGIGLGIALWCGWLVYAHLVRSPGSEVFVTEAEHFKYGGLTNEKVRGLPLYIFEALPEVFSDKVPGTNGWQSFGLIQEPNRPGPVGWSVRTNGYPHLLPNCALCHTATYRVGGEATPRLIVGGVTLQLDFQALLQFLFACAHDARFTDGTLLAVIQRRHSLDAVDTALYGRLLIPVTAGALQLAGQDCGWMNRQPPSGPGRFDAGALLKFNLLRLPYDGAISTSDMLPIWNQRAEQGRWQRWTGGGTNVHEEMMLSAGSLAALVPMLFDEASFQRIAKFLETLSPPKYPLPVAADLAAQGKSVFTARCLECHAAEGISVHGQLTAQRELGTDPEVLQAYDARTVAALHALKEAPLRYPAQQQTDGYKNVSLTGLWARAPYLHNGSVPTLWDLLLPPENRPETFVRGGNEVDATRLGFIAGAAGTQGKPFLFDTRLRGNSNRGHLYGVDLPEADKRALIEFLKTL